MSAGTEPKRQDDELELVIDEAIVTCGGDMRATIRTLIIANDYLESEVKELVKAVSRAYVRGRFKTYTG
jgi:hypothetical protein